MKYGISDENFDENYTSTQFNGIPFSFICVLLSNIVNCE